MELVVSSSFYSPAVSHTLHLSAENTSVCVLLHEQRYMSHLPLFTFGKID